MELGVQAENSLLRVERAVREELTTARNETSGTARLLREEVAASFKTLSDASRATMIDLAKTQKVQLEGFASSLTQAEQEGARAGQALREEIANALTRLGSALNETIAGLSRTQTEKLEDVTKQITTLIEGNEARQEAFKATIESNLSDTHTNAIASATQLREEVARSIKAFGDGSRATMIDLANSQKTQLDGFASILNQVKEENVTAAHALR
jgi:hypothetical protein